MSATLKDRCPNQPLNESAFLFVDYVCVDARNCPFDAVYMSLADVLARLHLPEMPEGFNSMYLRDDFLHHTAHYKQYGMYFSILLNYNLCENEQNPKTRN